MPPNIRVYARSWFTTPKIPLYASPKKILRRIWSDATNPIRADCPPIVHRPVLASSFISERRTSETDSRAAGSFTKIQRFLLTIRPILSTSRPSTYARNGSTGLNEKTTTAATRSSTRPTVRSEFSITIRCVAM